MTDQASNKSYFVPELMRAAENLLIGSHAMFVAHKSESEGGWLDLYSHEPFESCKEILGEVVEALAPFLTEQNSRWEYRLFCRDGYVNCLSDGTAVDDDGEPISGRNVFEENSACTSGDSE